jgi:hypothetical protein
MDVAIMLLVLAIVILIWRGARRGLILGLWAIGLVAMLGLFQYHITSPLDLNF